jgi:hypothetical protein
MSLLAWIPLIEPMPGVIHWWWAWIVPMVLGVSMTWKAIRLKSLDRYWPEVARMSGQVLAGMVALTAGLILLVRVVLPLLPAD